MQNMLFSAYLFYKVLLTRFGCGVKFNDIFVTNCFIVNFYDAYYCLYIQHLLPIVLNEAIKLSAERVSEKNLKIR